MRTIDVNSRDAKPIIVKFPAGKPFAVNSVFVIPLMIILLLIKKA